MAIVHVHWKRFRRFFIWQLTLQSPNRQSTTKISCYTTCIVFSMQYAVHIYVHTLLRLPYTCTCDRLHEGTYKPWLTGGLQIDMYVYVHVFPMAQPERMHTTAIGIQLPAHLVGMDVNYIRGPTS